MNDASWFLDSGATHHVAATSDSMTAKLEYSGNGKLALGDGSHLPITDIGNFISLPHDLLVSEIFGWFHQ